MSDYRLEFGSEISVADSVRVNSLLNLISKKDRLDLIIKDSDTSKYDIIFDILENNRIKIINREEANGVIHITSYKTD